jgi:hypothetical protein
VGAGAEGAGKEVLLNPKLLPTAPATQTSTFFLKPRFTTLHFLSNNQH